MFGKSPPSDICPKHNAPYSFVCSAPSCPTPLFCELCSKSDPQHLPTHKIFLIPLGEFLNTQNGKLSQKLIPVLNQMLSELDQKNNIFYQKTEGEIKEIDIDFATLFKVFFNLSEAAKTFLKDNMKIQSKKATEKLSSLKKLLKDMHDQENSKNENFLTNLFSKDTDKLEAKTIEELVNKLLTRNVIANKLRSEIMVLAQEIESNQPASYKKNEQARKLFEEIKENFEKSCKEMYRQFKMLVQGGDPTDLRKSIFAMKKSLVGPPQTVSIDLDVKNDRNSMASSMVKSFKPSKSKFINIFINFILLVTSFKKLASFPEISNPNIQRALSKFGQLNFNSEVLFN